jgi:hypothetical protein
VITAANSSFSARSDEVRELSLQVIRIDRNLRRGFNESALEQEMTLGRRDYVGSNSIAPTLVEVPSDPKRRHRLVSSPVRFVGLGENAVEREENACKCDGDL